MSERFQNALAELALRITTVEAKLGINHIPQLVLEGTSEEQQATIDALKNMGITVLSDDSSLGKLTPNPELEKELNKPLASMDDEYGPYIVRYRLPGGHILIWKRAPVSGYNKLGFELSVLNAGEVQTRFSAEN